jgi:hypothetical protein
MGCGDKTVRAESAPAPRPARAPKPKTLLASVVLSAPGAGTEMAKLLADLGVEYTESCRCLEYARRMNARGVQWCRRNRYLISAWLGLEVKERGMPFDRDAAYVVIDQAIENAGTATAG